MRKYETVFISDPDLSTQAREELFERVRNIIERENGIILDFDEWGLKKLSYEIKKKLRGHYVCLTYGGTGELVTELERNFRLSDLIMKFMTILITEHVSEESLKQEAAEAAQAADQAKEAAAREEEEKAAAQAKEAAEKEKEKAAEKAQEAAKEAQADSVEETETAEENAGDQEEAQEAEPEQTPEPAEESKE